MSLDAFLYNLHYETATIKPQTWKVNWGDSPLPYKLYRKLPTIELPSDIPLHLEQKDCFSKPILKDIGNFLWYTFGLTQVSQSFYIATQTEGPPTYRRFVPSGGALYPNELYIYLKTEDAPEGVYHYDVAHHRLVLLRQGNFDDYLCQALGNRCDITSSFGVIFISTFFWKNFFKYHNFSYRLQGLDTGIVLGQLLEVAQQFHFDTGIYYQFLDQAINHLLGISEHEESVYAVVPLSTKQTMTWFSDASIEKMVSSTQLCSDLPHLEHHHYIRSKEIIDYPMLKKINKACFIDSLPPFQSINDEISEVISNQLTLLPHTDRLTYDFALACQNRYSPGMDFTPEQINQEALSTLLLETTSRFSYRNDIDNTYKEQPFRISLYGCAYNISGVPNGTFFYDYELHALKTIQSGDFRNHLQCGLLSNFVHMSQIPLSFNIVGNIDHYKSIFGYRGYRIQQMEAGMLTQHLLLAASALNMNGHPILGFDVNAYDSLYTLDKKRKTSLLQIPLGYFHSQPRMQGVLHN